MTQEEFQEMRKDITNLIDDVKFHSDSLTDLNRLPVIQLKVILAKINKLTQKTTVLLHYVEKTDSPFEEQTTSDEIKLPDAPASNTEVVSSKEVKPEARPEELSPSENVVEEKKEPISEAIETHTLGELPGLLSAIGINEKYLFASTLFEGDMHAFISFLDELNKIEDPKELDKTLNEVTSEYNWDLENQVIDDFFTLVRKRLEN